MLRDSGGALGDDLRYLAIEGKDTDLRKRLENVANTASADDLGITPLMYAVSGLPIFFVLRLILRFLLFLQCQKRCGMDMWSA